MAHDPVDSFWRNYALWLRPPPWMKTVYKVRLFAGLGLLAGGAGSLIAAEDFDGWVAIAIGAVIAIEAFVHLELDKLAADTLKLER